MDYGDEYDQDQGSHQLGSGVQSMGSKGILFGSPNDNFNPFAAASINQQPPKKRKIRNYDKIVTNTKYRQYDIESCGSALFKDWEFSNEELDIRDLIKKVEGRKQRREKKRKKQL